MLYSQTKKEREENIMKKKNIALTGIITALLLTGCQTTNNTAETDELKQQIAQLEQQVTELEQQGTTAVVPETTPAENSTTDTLENLTKQVDDFAAKAEAAAPGNDNAVNTETFFSLKKESNQIENALDRHEDELERQLRAGTLTKEAFRETDRELERLEDILDNTEDRLEYTFGIDD